MGENFTLRLALHLFALAKQHVDESRDKADSLHSQQIRTQQELQRTLTERDWVVTQARKGVLTTPDMENQLRSLTWMEVNLKRELTRLGRSININALENWERKIEEYWADLEAGIDEIKNAAPQTPEEQHQVFLLKKRIINSLVSRVTIDKQRNLKVEIRFNLFDLEDNNPNQDDGPAVQVTLAETCTHRQSPRAHRRHCASCA